MPALMKLSLVGNKIKKIQNSNNLPSLEELKLHGNQIEILENLAGLPSLFQLNFSNFGIKKIGEGIELSGLRTLILDNNKIEVF